MAFRYGVGTTDEATTTITNDDASLLTSITNPRGHTGQIRYNKFYE